jgi:hypothetical protein
MTRMTPSSIWTTPVLGLLLAASAGSVSGCGDGDAAESDGTGGRGTGGSTSSGGLPTRGGSSNASGASGEAGSSGDEAARYVAGGWLTTPDQEYIGYLAVLGDISAGSEIDLGQVVEFPGDIAYSSPGDGSVYVVLATEPTIQRWVLDANDQLTLDDEFGLAQYGITDGVRKSAPVFFDDSRAYFFDGDTLQLILWNPSTMRTVEAISLAGLEEEGYGMRTNYLHRDGNRLLLSASYWRLTNEEGYLELNRVAIVDTSDHSVTYADDTRCGGVAFHATDSKGHLYLASHPGHAAALSVGMAHTEGVSEPAASCLLRVKAGQNEIDPDYYVDLNEISGGFTGGLMQGPGDVAYVLTYDGPELSATDYFRATRADAWAIHSLTLGDEADSYRRVPDMPLVSGYGFAFSTSIDGSSTPFVIVVNGDLSEGVYYDASDANGFTRALTLPGSPGNAIRVR